jgi:ribonuclease E
MLEQSHQEKVEAAFRKAVYSDRARVQISGISKFGLLEVSRQRLRPSLNESYDIEHVLVRGPRSLGQSILRIIGEDSAKDNTGEIQVYVPADVASYLLNEKRNDIINIEKTNNIRVLVIADPYKSRPYYKVIRVKASDIKNIESYNLTPKSPEPDTSWRDDKNKSKIMKPVVDGIKPPKMPKKKKDGLVSWIKSIAGIDGEDKPKAKTKPKRGNQNKRRKPTSANKQKQNQPRNINKKNVSSNPKKSPQKKKEPNKLKPDSSNNKTLDKKKIIDPKPKDKAPKKEKVNKEQVNKSKPIKKEVEKAPTKKEPAIKEIVKEPKIKKEIPTRAANDPRYKN